MGSSPIADVATALSEKYLDIQTVAKCRFTLNAYVTWHKLTVLKGIFCSSMKQTFIQNVCCWISSNQFDLNTINLKLYSDERSGTYNSGNIHWRVSWLLLLKKASHVSKTWQKKPRYLKFFFKKIAQTRTS